MIARAAPVVEFVAGPVVGFVAAAQRAKLLLRRGVGAYLDAAGVPKGDPRRDPLATKAETDRARYLADVEYLTKTAAGDLASALLVVGDAAAAQGFIHTAEAVRDWAVGVAEDTKSVEMGHSVGDVRAHWGFFAEALAVDEAAASRKVDAKWLKWAVDSVRMEANAYVRLWRVALWLPAARAALHRAYAHVGDARCGEEEKEIVERGLAGAIVALDGPLKGLASDGVGPPDPFSDARTRGFASEEEFSAAVRAVYPNVKSIRAAIAAAEVCAAGQAGLFTKTVRERIAALPKKAVVAATTAPPKAAWAPRKALADIAAAAGARSEDLVGSPFARGFARKVGDFIDERVAAGADATAVLDLVVARLQSRQGEAGYPAGWIEEWLEMAAPPPPSTAPSRYDLYVDGTYIGSFPPSQLPEAAREAQRYKDEGSSVDLHRVVQDGMAAAPPVPPPSPPVVSRWTTAPASGDLPTTTTLATATEGGFAWRRVAIREDALDAQIDAYAASAASVEVYLQTDEEFAAWTAQIGEVPNEPNPSAATAIDSAVEGVAAPVAPPPVGTYGFDVSNVAFVDGRGLVAVQATGLAFQPDPNGGPAIWHQTDDGDWYKFVPVDGYLDGGVDGLYLVDGADPAGFLSVWDAQGVVQRASIPVVATLPVVQSVETLPPDPALTKADAAILAGQEALTAAVSAVLQDAVLDRQRDADAIVLTWGGAKGTARVVLTPAKASGSVAVQASVAGTSLDYAYTHAGEALAESVGDPAVLFGRALDDAAVALASRTASAAAISAAVIEAQAAEIDPEVGLPVSISTAIHDAIDPTAAGVYAAGRVRFVFIEPREV